MSRWLILIAQTSFPFAVAGCSSNSANSGVPPLRSESITTVDSAAPRQIVPVDELRMMLSLHPNFKTSLGRVLS